LRDIIDAGRFPGRVLLVEDEALIQMLAVEYLEEAGFKVDTAGSATEAMNKLALIPGGVDAVVLDVGLPDRSGEILLQEIRAIHPLLPVVLATGQGAADLARAFQGQSKVAIATKPYDAGDLLKALRSLGIDTKNKAPE
jgi:DNA-binding NtrC family response regulator